MGKVPENGSVVRIPPRDAHLVTEVLSDAFADYPVMRFVLGECGTAYPGRLQKLVGFFVMARALRDEPLLGVTLDGRLCAAATVSFPDGSGEPHALGELRERLWRELSPDARKRYEACGEAWGSFRREEPHIHLNMIGVRRDHQGKGMARKLLEHVHGISLETPGSNGVTLTTESPSNLPFYRYMGYEIVGHARVAPELETWGMYRKN